MIVHLPSTQELRDAFADEIASVGGVVTDIFDDRCRLITRAVLPTSSEIRPNDAIHAGVAVRATESDIMVHPYTFRQVCTNGAIAAHALGSQRLERMQSAEVYVPEYETAVILSDFREAVRAAAAPETCALVTDEMRAAADDQADLVLNLAPMLARLSSHGMAHLVPHILARFHADGDLSTFGLMNAFTSVAREVTDAETRWNLEEIGGTLPAWMSVHREPRSHASGGHVAHQTRCRC